MHFGLPLGFHLERTASRHSWAPVHSQHVHLVATRTNKQLQTETDIWTDGRTGRQTDRQTIETLTPVRYLVLQVFLLNERRLFFLTLLPQILHLQNIIPYFRNHIQLAEHQNMTHSNTKTKSLASQPFERLSSYNT